MTRNKVPFYYLAMVLLAAVSTWAQPASPQETKTKQGIIRDISGAAMALGVTDKAMIDTEQYMVDPKNIQVTGNIAIGVPVTVEYREIEGGKMQALKITQSPPQQLSVTVKVVVVQGNSTIIADIDGRTVVFFRDPSGKVEGDLKKDATAEIMYRVDDEFNFIAMDINVTS
jgi:hypothetical protein